MTTLRFASAGRFAAAAAALGLFAVFVSGCSRDEAGAASASASGPTGKDGPKEPPTVESAKVRRADVVRAVVLPAELTAWREVTLYAKVAGYLKEFRPAAGTDRPLDIGDEIASAEGEAAVVAVLDAPELEAEVARRKAEVAHAEADVRRATADAATAESAVEETRRERVSAEALVRKAAGAVRSAEADLARARSDLALAQATQDRYKRLAADKTVTEIEADQVRAKWQAATSEVAAAEARVAALRDEAGYAEARQGEVDARTRTAAARLESARAAVATATAAKAVAAARLAEAETVAAYRFLRTPFPGRVVRRFVDPGAMIQAATASSTQATPVLTVSDQSRLRVVVDVPEAEVRFLSPETAGVLTVPEMPGATWPVKAGRNSVAVKPGTRTLRVEMDLPNAEGKLRSGLYGQVRLVMETRKGATVVPPAAVGGKGAERFVFVLSDGKAAKRPVELGFHDGDAQELRPAVVENGKTVKGVADGETVLLPGATVLRDGQAVKLKTAG